MLEVGIVMVGERSKSSGGYPRSDGRKKGRRGRWVIRGERFSKERSR